MRGVAFTVVAVPDPVDARLLALVAEVGRVAVHDLAKRAGLDVREVAARLAALGAAGFPVVVGVECDPAALRYALAAQGWPGGSGPHQVNPSSGPYGPAPTGPSSGPLPVPGYPVAPPVGASSASHGGPSGPHGPGVASASHSGAAGPGGVSAPHTGSAGPGETPVSQGGSSGPGGGAAGSLEQSGRSAGGSFGPGGQAAGGWYAPNQGAPQQGGGSSSTGSPQGGAGTGWTEPGATNGGTSSTAASGAGGQNVGGVGGTGMSGPGHRGSGHVAADRAGAGHAAPGQVGVGQGGPGHGGAGGQWAPGGAGLDPLGTWGPPGSAAWARGDANAPGAAPARGGPGGGGAPGQEAGAPVKRTGAVGETLHTEGLEGERLAIQLVEVVDPADFLFTAAGYRLQPGERSVVVHTELTNRGSVPFSSLPDLYLVLLDDEGQSVAKAPVSLSSRPPHRIGVKPGETAGGHTVYVLPEETELTAVRWSPRPDDEQRTLTWSVRE